MSLWLHVDFSRSYLLMGLNVHSNLLQLIRDRGKVGGWVPMSYHLLTTLSPPEWLCTKVGSCARHFNVSLIVPAKSQGGVHKLPFLQRKESWSVLNQGPSAYQPSALPLGHTACHNLLCVQVQWDATIISGFTFYLPLYLSQSICFFLEYRNLLENWSCADFKLCLWKEVCSC